MLYFTIFLLFSHLAECQITEYYTVTRTRSIVDSSTSLTIPIQNFQTSASSTSGASFTSSLLLVDTKIPGISTATNVIIVPLQTTSTRPNPSTMPVLTGQRSNEITQPGTIAAFGLGALLIVVILGGLFWCIWVRRCKQRRRRKSEHHNLEEGKGGEYVAKWKQGRYGKNRNDKMAVWNIGHPFPIEVPSGMAVIDIPGHGRSKMVQMPMTLRSVTKPKPAHIKSLPPPPKSPSQPEIQVNKTNVRSTLLKSDQHEFSIVIEGKEMEQAQPVFAKTSICDYFSPDQIAPHPSPPPKDQTRTESFSSSMSGRSAGRSIYKHFSTPLQSAKTAFFSSKDSLPSRKISIRTSMFIPVSSRREARSVYEQNPDHVPIIIISDDGNHSQGPSTSMPRSRSGRSHASSFDVISEDVEAQFAIPIKHKPVPLQLSPPPAGRNIPRESILAPSHILQEISIPPGESPPLSPIQFSFDTTPQVPRKVGDALCTNWHTRASFIPPPPEHQNAQIDEQLHKYQQSSNSEEDEEEEEFIGQDHPDLVEEEVLIRPFSFEAVDGTEFNRFLKGTMDDDDEMVDSGYDASHLIQEYDESPSFDKQQARFNHLSITMSILDGKTLSCQTYATEIENSPAVAYFRDGFF